MRHAITTTLFSFLVAVCALVPPFLLGRALGPSRCKTCARQQAQANRARANGEAAAARLAARAGSPQAARDQAVADLQRTDAYVRAFGITDQRDRRVQPLPPRRPPLFPTTWRV